MPIGTDGCCRFGLDQGIQPLVDHFRDEFAANVTTKQLLQLTGGTIRDGHGLLLRLDVLLKPGSQIGPPIAPQGICEANQQCRLGRRCSSGFTQLGGTLLICSSFSSSAKPSRRLMKRAPNAIRKGYYGAPVFGLN
jgi:hypothetical protein